MDSLLIKLIADGLIIPIVLIGIIALLKIPMNEKYRTYCRILMAGLTAVLLAKLIAQIYQPEMERPFQLLGQKAGAAYLDNPGFPSDHTLLCMAITLAVWFETKYRRTALLLLVLTIGVAIGRVLALVHTPLDVVGGIIIACGGIPWYLTKQPIRKETRKKFKKQVK